MNTLFTKFLFAKKLFFFLEIVINFYIIFFKLYIDIIHKYIYLTFPIDGKFL